MNNLDKQYQALLETILEHGVQKKDRTGTGTKSIFGYTIRHNMRDGFPLLTTKKMYMKGVIAELLWFLRGETNIQSLVKQGCNIWNGDAYKNYCNDPRFLGHEVPDINWFVEEIKNNDDFAKKYGELGPIYGKQWRKWEHGEDKAVKNGKTYPSGEFMYDIKKDYVDQIASLIEDLKHNPDSRRLMVSAWNVGEIDQMVLPPCHYGFQCWTRLLTLDERMDIASTHPHFDPFDFGIGEQVTESHCHFVCDKFDVPRRALSLMWNQRSVDTFLGLPFNIASYGLLLEILAKEVHMVPDQLIGSLGDTHLYMNHLEQAEEQISREPFVLPKLNIRLHFKNEPSFVPEQWLIEDFEIENYQSHPAIKAGLSN